MPSSPLFSQIRPLVVGTIACILVLIFYSDVEKGFNWLQLVPATRREEFPRYYPKEGSGLYFLDDNYYYAKSPSEDQSIILLWTKLFGRNNWGLGKLNRELPEKLKCPISNCFVTRDRMYLKDASAVLVHFRDDFNYRDLPKLRPRNQFWIFFLWESPDHTYHWIWQSSQNSRQILRNFTNFFNWTMTYRLDSDIPAIYGRFSRLASPSRVAANYGKSFFEKTKNIVWLQSHCDTRSHRREYLFELRKYIDVEVIGNCGWESKTEHKDRNVCHLVSNALNSTSDACNAYLNSTFKFFFAAENSLCKDYVTEKFYRAASLDLIPVVFNGANMSRFAPPHSYIDVRDFDSPRHLTGYLNKIANNQELFESFFWWKQFYKVDQLYNDYDYVKHFCQLCAKVQQAKLEPVKYRKIYNSIDNWWMTLGACYSGKTNF